ncbi:MAG: choice-of-anchor L domain-containing protein [Myxococcales bacterium]|nr:choice-of-anchor L domain-containing protein [Myxococcales bacterium]
MNRPTRRALVGAGFAALWTACGGDPPGTDSFGSQTESAPTTVPAATTGELESTGEVPTSSGSSTGFETSSASSSSSTGDVPPECSADEDCADHPGGPVCSGGQCTTPCAPGATKPCYSGPDGTLDVGPCRRGEQTCSEDGMTWSACAGEVVPEAVDLCANTVDDDCNGAVDDDPDADGDGWGACAGDCCDADGGDCFDAAQVNPGAYEYVGNAVDDDCDGDIDEVEAACDDALTSNSGDALDYARALDLCSFTTPNPDDPRDRTWGVLDAELSLADGSGSPAANSRSIRPGFGDVIKSQRGARLAVFSSGHAADADDQSPAHAAFEPGKDMKTTSPPPADWLDANGGMLPNPMGCVAPAVPAANDAVMLTLTLRVPTNAKSFSAKMYFFSAEYPEWVCSDYNDFFVALVDSSADNPEDKNVAVYDDGQTKWPIGVNLALVADGLFRQCDNGPVGCAVMKNTNYDGCDGTAQLAGTGFDAFDDYACNMAQDNAGGATGWLNLHGNVTPGETMTIRLAVWDSGGHIYDSLVLLDAWEWSVDPAKPGVTPG